MVLQIAGISIKIDLAADQYPTTDYFNKACSAYSISGEARYDFKVTMGDYNKAKRDIKAVFSRNTISYSEYGNESFFFSDSSECCIQWKEKTATLAFAPKVFRYDVLFMDYIKMLVSFIAIERGGLPLHSSAVYNEIKGGLLFFCPSGGGKTTIAGLMASHWKVLSDEFNMVMPRNGTYFVHSTPFTAPENHYLCTSGSAPLRKLFKLSKGASTLCQEMPHRDKYMSLGQSIYSIIATQTLGDKILENMDALCRCIPMQILTFAKNPSIAVEIGNAIG